MNATARPSSASPVSWAGRARRWWATGCLWLAGLTCVAADAPAPSGRVITSFEQLWNIPAEKKQELFPLRFEFLVYFHDPTWKVAWGNVAGIDNFVPLGPVPFPVKPGQRILIEGEVVPALGMNLDRARITALGDPRPLPEAMATAGAFGEIARFEAHRVTVEGKVTGQTLIDSTHLTLELQVENRTALVHLRLDGWSAPPELTGAQVALRGVYSGIEASGEPKSKIELWVHDLQDIAVFRSTAEGPPVAQPLERTITNIHEFDRVPDRLKNVPQRVRFDYLVYYHDPDWKVAWGNCGGINHYLTLAQLPFPVKPGQRIRIEGLVVPADGLRFDQHTTYTLLGEEPLPPDLITKGHVRETGRFDNQPVVMEGFVDQQTVFNSTHVKVDFVSEGWPVVVRLLLPGDQSPPRLEGQRLRIRGIYSATVDPTTAHLSVALWVQGLQDVEVIGSMADDEQFAGETTPIEAIPTKAAGPGSLVKIAGVVRRQQPGASLTVRDDTGQVFGRTVQLAPVPVGSPVEMIGSPTYEKGEWVLRDAIWRPAQEPVGNSRGGVTHVRLAEQLLELPPEEAALGYPVHLNGIVTWANPAAEHCFIRDASGGACVLIPYELSSVLTVGTTVTVEGTTRPGKFVPYVQASSVVRLAQLELPEAKEVTLEQAMTGVEELQWVSLSGYVRNIIPDGPWRRLELTTVAGNFSALMPMNEPVDGLRGSVIRLRGVCRAVANSNRQLMSIVVWVPSSQYIGVEEAEPADPYTVAPRSLASLRQFNSLKATNRRVRIAGVVTHHQPGRLLLIQEGPDTLEILSQGLTALKPGDHVEAVGFPGRENNRVVLREAVYRKVSSGMEPTPQILPRLDPLDLNLDGRLVRIEGGLLEQSTQDKNMRLVLRSERIIFEAVLDTGTDGGPAGLMPGSRVALTGVYRMKFDEYKQPEAMQLQLRSMNDVQVLQRAPWWTASRALVAAGVLATCIVLGVGWVVALRRRVRLQTGQIREQVESEKAARLEAALARASKLESLGVLAGGIAHDFNNLLTVVLGNLSMARLDARLEPDNLECLKESERAALRARDLTQQLITFSKGGEPVRAMIELPEVVQEAAHFALHGSKVRCDFELPAGLWPVHADKGQMSQVIHNLIINAVHAMPAGGVIRIGLRNEQIVADERCTLAPGSYVRLTITDAGAGIAPELLPRIFDPYFTTKRKGSGLGLASVYSIIKRHEGQIDVKSTLGVGTTFQIWLPAKPAAPVAPVPAIEETKPRVSLRARLLLMDDDPSIRQLGGAIIKRLGLEHTTVADGAEMLREYEAAKTAGRPYDLVLLDLTVPGGMGGVEGMKKLLQLDPKARVVVSSGYSNDPVMANYRAYGFLGVVAKPYVLTEFMKVVVPILTERESRE